MTARHRNKPTQDDREAHEATDVPFRDWCVHCMMGRGRTHHTFTKPKSEDQSRRSTVAMDYYFMKHDVCCEMSVESVTCTAVKEDRHQNIMSSVALKKRVAEPWTL